METKGGIQVTVRRDDQVTLQTQAGPLTLPRPTAMQLAASYADQGNLTTAEEICRRILEGSPRDADALLFLTWIAGRHGDAAAASSIAAALAQNAGMPSLAPRFVDRFAEPQLYDPLLLRAFGDGGAPKTDMSDHVPKLFETALSTVPRLIVELGTRDGQSTKALAAVAHHAGGQLLSVDIEPCGDIDLPVDMRSLWHFVQSDDIDFGRSRFAGWCAGIGLAPEIDALFIDTSHEYEHTRREIEIWLPFVRDGGVAMFHDTNLTYAYRRNDLSVGRAWNNQRGVIRAIEEALGRTWDETAYFVDIAGDWIVTHDPISNGFTVLRRRPQRAGARA